MLRLGLVVRLWRMVRLIVRLWNISLPSLALDIVLVVTGSDVFIEDRTVATVERVLFTIVMAEVIDLRNQEVLV